MGTVLSGYGEDAYDHEGYPAHVLDDGSLTATSSPTTRPRMIGQVVAACGCGWTGTTRYPCPQPCDEHAQTLALAEWETNHARPVLERCQAQRWDRLQRLLAAAGDRLAHRTALPRRADVLEHTLRDLTTATELARDLQDTVAHSEQGVDR